MLKFLGLLLSLAVTTAAYGQDTIRVLLGQEKILNVQTSYPVDISTGASDISISSPSAINIEIKNRHWVIEVKSRVGKAQSKTYTVQSHSLILTAPELQWKKQFLRHPLALSANGQTISVIAYMPVDEYLKGVIPHEMPPLWPMETLKAQVVASRTYALWKVQSQRNDNYDVQATVMDQVFRLPALSQKKTSNEYRVEDAIASTHNQVLSKNKALLKTYFHSDCGGSTESAKSIWGSSAVDNSAAKDKACHQRKENQWTSRWTSQRLSHSFLSEFYLPANLELVDVIIRSRFESQRVDSVDLIFSKGIFKRLRGEDVRRILGYDKIKSTLFSLNRVDGAWVFEGKGHGHGVGMCQWGARSMAKAGKNYKEILSHYYPQSQLSLQKESTPASSLSQNEGEKLSF